MYSLLVARSGGHATHVSTHGPGRPLQGVRTGKQDDETGFKTAQFVLKFEAVPIGSFTTLFDALIASSRNLTVGDRTGIYSGKIKTTSTGQ